MGAADALRAQFLTVAISTKGRINPQAEVHRHNRSAFWTVRDRRAAVEFVPGTRAELDHTFKSFCSRTIWALTETKVCHPYG